MMEILRRDSYGVGVVLGLLVPAVLFGILYGIYMLVVKANPQILVNKPNLTHVLIPDFILIALIPNVFIMRHYLLKLKFDKTGRGILAITFLWAIVFVAAQFLL